MYRIVLNISNVNRARFWHFARPQQSQARLILGVNAEVFHYKYVLAMVGLLLKTNDIKLLG